MEFLEVTEKEEMDEVREIFLEYQEYLNLELDFQDFEQELEELPGEYSPPGGIILLAKDGEQVIGSAALRRIDRENCEMKRLFVKDAYRGKGVGRKLAKMVIQEAKNKGYSRMKLDTLERLTKANRLYRELGFEECEPYRYNPLPNAKFMELEL